MASVGRPTNGADGTHSGAIPKKVYSEPGAYPPGSDAEGDPGAVRERVEQAGRALAGMVAIPLGEKGTGGVLLRPATAISTADQRWLDSVISTNTIHPLYLLGGVEEETVAGTREALRQALTFDGIYRAARERLGKSRDDILREDVVAKGILKKGLSPDEERFTLRAHSTETGFVRHATDFFYLTDHVIPSLEGQEEIIIGDFGPGATGPLLPNDLLNVPEPYRLAGLSHRARVVVYEWAEESVVSVRGHEGYFHIGQPWEADGLETPAAGAALMKSYGGRWRDNLRLQKLYFDSFVAKHGGQVTPLKMHQSETLGKIPLVQVSFPSLTSFGVVEPPEHPIDFTLKPFDSRPMDIAFFKHARRDLNGSGTELFSYLTLVRIVHHLKAGGYLVTDAHRYKEPENDHEIFFPHSPSPQLMRVLGLEPVYEADRSLYPKTMGPTIFRKVGESNDVVREVATLAEKALARARVDHASGASMPPPPPPPAADSAPSALSPPADSLRTDNPYRYPAFDPHDPHRYSRSRPANDSNIVAAMREWREVLDVPTLREVTERTRGMSEKEKIRDGVTRLGLGNTTANFTLTFFNNLPGLYPFLFGEHSPLAGMSTDAQLAVGSFGAGLVDLESEYNDAWLRGIRRVIAARRLSLRGVVVESTEILSQILHRFPHGRYDVFDMDSRVVETLRAPEGLYPMPLYGFDGTPLQAGRRQFADTMIRRNRLIGRDTVTNGPQGPLEIALLQIPKKQRGKMRVHHVDIGTEILPYDASRSHEEQQLHVAFYLQTAYFMDPLLQRAAFVKIVDRTRVGGLIVSDYLLSEAEVHAFGLRILACSNRHQHIEGVTDDRDAYLHIYVRVEETDFVRAMMDRVRQAQGEREPEPGSPVSGGGGGRTVAGHQALVASLGGEAIVNGPWSMVQGYDGRGMTDEGRQMISGYAAHMARFGDQPVMGISGDAVELVPEIVPDYLEEDVAGFSIIDGGLSLVGARHAVPVQAANNSLYSVDSDLDNVFTDWHRVLRMNNREDLIPVVQVIRDLDDRQRLLVVLNRIAEDSANVAWLFEEVAELRRAQPHEGAVSRQAVPQQNAGWHVPAAVVFQFAAALRIAPVGMGAR